MFATASKLTEKVCHASAGSDQLSSKFTDPQFYAEASPISKKFEKTDEEITQKSKTESSNNNLQDPTRTAKPPRSPLKLSKPPAAKISEVEQIYKSTSINLMTEE